MSTTVFRPNRRAFLLFAGTGAALAACSNIIGPPEASPIYMLRPQVPPAGGGARVPWQLNVLMPDAPHSLDTDRIVLVHPEGQMDVYADAIWQDRLPAAVQSALIEAFEATSRIVSVARESEGLRADYQLETEIKDFQARYDVQDAPPTVVVRLEAKLIAAQKRVVALVVTGSGQAQTAQNNVPSVVAAFNQALAQAIQPIVTEVLTAPMPPPR